VCSNRIGRTTVRRPSDAARDRAPAGCGRRRAWPTIAPIAEPPDTDHDDADGTDPSVIDAMPGLVRIATRTGFRAARWGAAGSVRTGVEVTKRLPFGGLALRAVEEVAGHARRGARNVLGVEEVERRLLAAAPVWTHVRGRGHHEKPEDPVAVLQQRGAGLLQQSADVSFVEETHPAYARILDELTPDEARILRLMATTGPQPSVDVRTGRPLRIGSELVASGLTVIGSAAGCRYLERVPAYLNNLFRLGLIWFSHEELHDLRGYQVLEAQPEVTDARKHAGRAARVVRRSIALTPFGTDFCTVCLPLDGVPSPSRPTGA
jgi:hypothetical protein